MDRYLILDIGRLYNKFYDTSSWNEITDVRNTIKSQNIQNVLIAVTCNDFKTKNIKEQEEILTSVRNYYLSGIDKINIHYEIFDGNNLLMYEIYSANMHNEYDILLSTNEDCIRIYQKQTDNYTIIPYGYTSFVNKKETIDTKVIKECDSYYNEIFKDLNLTGNKILAINSTYSTAVYLNIPLLSDLSDVIFQIKSHIKGEIPLTIMENTRYKLFNIIMLRRLFKNIRKQSKHEFTISYDSINWMQGWYNIEVIK